MSDADDRPEYGCRQEGWWRFHPLYKPLVESFRRHSWQAPHLAFLAITGLVARGHLTETGTTPPGTIDPQHAAEFVAQARAWLDEAGDDAWPGPVHVRRLLRIIDDKVTQ